MENLKERFIPDILTSVCDYLDINSVIQLQKTCRFFSQSLQEYKRKRPEFIPYNLKHLNCDKKILIPKEAIHKIGLWRNIIVAANRRSIWAINKVTAEELWCHSFGERIERFHIVDGKIICFCRNKTYYLSYTVKLIDIETGKFQIIYENLTENMAALNYSNAELIEKLKNGIINCRDLSGSIKKTYESLPSERTRVYLVRNLLVTHSHIVDIEGCNITIIERETGQKETVVTPSFDDISSAKIFNDRIICSLFLTHECIISVDIKNKKILDTYSAKSNNFLLAYINSMIIKDNSVFLSASTAHDSDICNKIIKIDLENPDPKILEEFPHYCETALFLHEDLLFIHCPRKSLTIWDTKKMEKLRTISGLIHDFVWDKGNLYLSIDKWLIQCDFKVAHNEEKLVNTDLAEQSIQLRV